MIVDSHIHLGKMVSAPCVDASVQAMLSLMDSLHIDQSISTGSGLISGRTEVGFQTAVAAYEQSGGRLRSCAFFNPYYPGEDERWVRRCLAHKAFVGIKIHPPLVECYANDERWEPVWRLAAERHVPIVTHSWAVSDYNPTQRYATPELFERYVRAYPSVPFILGHSGGRYEGHRAAVALARKYANVHMDLSGDSYSLGLVEWLAQQAGAERVLFGSDNTMIDGRTTLGRVLDADLPAADKALILGENAVRVFGLVA